MPKSKRAKVVHLSQTAKKSGRAQNEKLFTLVREAADSFPFLYILRVANMRNTLLKDVRQEFSDSRLFFGKTKVMAKALCGSGPADEYMPGMANLSKYLKGDIGILFSSRSPEEVLGYFETYAPTSYARAGTEANEEFTIPEGIVYSMGGALPIDDDVPVPHSVESTLRKWGMPTRLEKGKVMLDQEYTVCKEGQVLDSNQTSLLKFFGVATAEFKVRIDAYWAAEEGKITAVDTNDDMEE